MTYVPAQKRWTKGYKGKTYSVSCKQLGCPPSKDASRLAANLWWEAKQQEIDAAERADPMRQTEDRINRALDGVDVAELQELVRKADAARILLAALDDRSERGEVGPTVFNLEAKRGHVSEAARMVQPVAAEGRSVGEQVEKWLTMLRVGNLDPATQKYYRHSIGRFVKWIGNGADVSLITAPKWEEYYAFLCVQVQENKLAQATAAESLKTARQFVTRLAELGLIPMPLNLNSRRLKFSVTPKEVPTFADDEVKRLLTPTDNTRRERARLFWLLMLNCGMLSADVADLGVKEVDWTAGTITRVRSKRRGKSSAQTVTYKLWPETFALLKRFRAKEKVPNENGDYRVLLTEKGRALNARWMVGGKLRSYDNIKSSWEHSAKAAGVSGKPPKLFRKTAATKLASHSQFKFYSSYFLAHSPKSVADRHYVKPSQDEFFAALDWLREQFCDVTAR
jgi:integrase